MDTRDKPDTPVSVQQDQTSHADQDQQDICADNKSALNITIVGVRLRPGQAVAHFDAGDVPVKDGEWVIASTEHGKEVGQVAGAPIMVNLKNKLHLPRLEGLASIHDIELYYHNLEKEKEAQDICAGFIKKLGLEMKLIRVERFFEGNKVIFYYSSKGRVDFRELVKELVKTLKIRIEMRQIGIRHESKMLGGIGSCGRELCCATFLKNFNPISIKMAKVQHLPLNPTKISGLCGRLLCCLTYEYETYLEMRKENQIAGISDEMSGDLSDMEEDIDIIIEDTQENTHVSRLTNGTPDDNRPNANINASNKQFHEKPGTSSNPRPVNQGRPDQQPAKSDNHKERYKKERYRDKKKKEQGPKSD
ncbi:MAG: PSP1 domain-containing protein [Dissulfurimicrobium sp.]|uniref:PSP1 domain-containing protein n=1 Tax=Dissulfurimicrobium sp. TaxID=2022436 RepID=UPI0040499128